MFLIVVFLAFFIPVKEIIVINAEINDTNIVSTKISSTEVGYLPYLAIKSDTINSIGKLRLNITVQNKENVSVYDRGYSINPNKHRFNLPVAPERGGSIIMSLDDYPDSRVVTPIR